ncbi:MAG: hypothetical protein ACTSX7_07300 [Alphaproteobacteria bacterium]
MKIVNTDASGYIVECGCEREFQGGRMRLTFECPRCGRAAYAAEIIGDWLLNRRGSMEATLTARR